MYTFCFAACVSHFDIIFKKVACMPYPFPFTLSITSPPWMVLVHCKVTPPPEFHQGLLIFCQYPFILLVERGMVKVKCFTPEYSRMNQPSLKPRLSTWSTLTFHSPVKSLYMYVANMYFTPTAPSTPSSVLEPLSDIWYRCRSGVCSPLCFSKLHNSFNTMSDNVHEQLRDSNW